MVSTVKKDHFYFHCKKMLAHNLTQNIFEQKTFQF